MIAAFTMAPSRSLPNLHAAKSALQGLLIDPWANTPPVDAVASTPMIAPLCSTIVRVALQNLPPPGWLS
ncbi:MAG: hypothetical protein K2Y21_11305 [Phycisphaerales bacterium]|nr:hypothetical protein [Phycisphaerales bacterium]